MPYSYTRNRKMRHRSRTLRERKKKDIATEFPKPDSGHPNEISDDVSNKEVQTQAINFI